MTALDSISLQRPFYFVVVLWGERFRDYFLEYCLPSLLAPGNIPALDRRRGSKFLIATRPDDWAAMTATPIFRRLAEYVEPVYIEIPPCPPEKSGCQHMGVGHSLATEIAYRDKAYAVMVTPDLMLSDGTMARVQELAQAGKQAVLVAALRFGEEPFLGNLEAAGAIPRDSRRDSGSPLSISGRAMVAAAVDGLHSETLRYEWGAPYFSNLPAACWWRVPDEMGMVVHSLSWAPLLLDYGAVDEHDTTALETWTMDADYVYKNLKDWHRIHVVQDSDEMFVASWAPLADKAFELIPSKLLQHRTWGSLTRSAILHAAYRSPVFDPLKRAIFFLPVRWHARPLNENWRAVERRAQRTILIVVGLPRRGAAKSAWSPESLAPKISRQAGPTTPVPDAATLAAPYRLGPGGAFSAGLLLRAWAMRMAIFGLRVANLGFRIGMMLTSIAMHGAMLGFRGLLWVVGPIYRVISVSFDIWRSRRVIFHKLGQIARGDREAKDYVTLRLRVVVARLLGRQLHPKLYRPEPTDLERAAT